jgi:hypothetical protein
MEPAHALAQLLPTEDTYTSFTQLMSFMYLCGTRFKALKQLLMALAWSAPAMVPGCTPHGMDPSEGGRQLWGEVASVCAVMLAEVLQRAPDAQQLTPEVLAAGQDTELQGGKKPRPWAWVGHVLRPP